MAGFLIAPTALHVDPGEETQALAVLERFVRMAGIDIARIRWEPYRKLGRNSRLTFYVLLVDCAGGQAVIDRMEAICASLLGGDPQRKGHVIHVPNDDGSFAHERIFDTRQTPFAIEEAHWFHIEINTYPDAQRDLVGLLSADRARLS